MKIGDLARETGVSPRLLRYYEEQGLLASERPSGGTADTVRTRRRPYAGSATCWRPACRRR